jgi:hypothetical protein
LPDQRNQFEPQTDDNKLRSWRAADGGKLLSDSDGGAEWIVYLPVALTIVVMLVLLFGGC